MTNYICTKCGKPAVFSWRRYGKIWASCKYDHGFEGECAFDLMEEPFNNYNYGNGYTIYKENGGIGE